MVENGERVSGVHVHKAVKENAKNLILFLIFSRKQGDGSNKITNYHIITLVQIMTPFRERHLGW